MIYTVRGEVIWIFDKVGGGVQELIMLVVGSFVNAVSTFRLGSVHRPNFPLNSWTPMTANMKRRRRATTKMFPMFFTEATMHCTTCFSPAALLMALGKRNMSDVALRQTRNI